MSKLHLNTKLNFSFFVYLIRDCATFLTNFSFSNKHGPDIKVSLSVSFLIIGLPSPLALGVAAGILSQLIPVVGTFLGGLVPFIASISLGTTSTPLIF